jgi:hypothetical protein
LGRKPTSITSLPRAGAVAGAVIHAETPTTGNYWILFIFSVTCFARHSLRVAGGANNTSNISSHLQGIISAQAACERFIQRCFLAAKDSSSR